jgi:hypothetical protein
MRIFARGQAIVRALTHASITRLDPLRLPLRRQNLLPLRSPALHQRDVGLEDSDPRVAGAEFAPLVLEIDESQEFESSRDSTMRRVFRQVTVMSSEPKGAD